MKTIKLVLFGLSLFFGSASQALENDKKRVLIIGMDETPILDSREAGDLIVDIYKKIGYRVEFRPAPMPRSTQDFLEGNIDGELFRVSWFSKVAPNSIRSRRQIAVMAVFAYYKKPCSYKKLDWKTIRENTVTHLRGILAARKSLNSKKNRDEIFEKSTLRELAYSVLDGQAKFALSYGVINNPEFAELCKVEIGHENLYHFLNKRHKDIMEKFDLELKKRSEKQR